MMTDLTVCTWQRVSVCVRRLEHASWLTLSDARALAAQAPHLRATPRTASSTKRPATIQNMATWATSLGDVGPVLWSVVVCTIEGRGGEASQHVQKTSKEAARS